VSFEIVSEIEGAETFAVGRSIRELPRLRKVYGKGRWRKRKGFARVRLPSGVEREAEIHWYEATGIGRKEFKIKRFLES
jgi:hypothetical protein